MPETPIILLGVGDTQFDGGSSSNTRATNNWNLVRATAHDVVCYCGDMTNNWTSAQMTDADARVKVGSPPQPWTEMHFSLGNHEYDYVPPTGWNWMNNGNAGASSSAPWHSFDTANGWHIIHISAAGSGPSIASGSAQYAWVTADLQANPNVPTLIFAHWGRYSGCSAHGNNTSLSALFAYCLANAPWVEAFISGHQHQYESFQRMNNSGAIDAVGGIRQFTMAPTGQTTSLSNSSPTGLVYYANSTYTGITKFSLYSDHYTWETLVPSGYNAITDTGSQTVRYPISTGAEYTVDPAADAESGQPVGSRKHVAVGMAYENDSGHTPIRRHLYALTSTTATVDVGQAFTARHGYHVGQPLETSDAQNVGRVKAKALAQSATTDTGQVVGRSESTAVGQTTETDIGQDIVSPKPRGIEPTEEVNEGMALSVRKDLAIGLAWPWAG